jgi:DNA-binding transcriptional ArsR family regulator
MELFSALSDPTRRGMLELLAHKGSLTASEIGAQFPISPPAVSQHLKVLREAGLVTMEKQAQQRILPSQPDRLQEMESWLHDLRELWNERFDAWIGFYWLKEGKTMENQYNHKLTIREETREIILEREFDAPPPWSTGPIPPPTCWRSGGAGTATGPKSINWTCTRWKMALCAAQRSGRRIQLQWRLQRGRAQPKTGLHFRIRGHARSHLCRKPYASKRWRASVPA